MMKKSQSLKKSKSKKEANGNLKFKKMILTQDNKLYLTQSSTTTLMRLNVDYVELNFLEGKNKELQLQEQSFESQRFFFLTKQLLPWMKIVKSWYKRLLKQFHKERQLS